jgi:hypothetical protein
VTAKLKMGRDMINAPCWGFFSIRGFSRAALERAELVPLWLDGKE